VAASRTSGDGQIIDDVPDDERAVAQLMRVQAACGQRGEALRTYHALSAYMASQLGAAPMEEIQRLADAIRAGETSAAYSCGAFTLQALT
jgi:DNA-binding SARP family transcriptional activator